MFVVRTEFLPTTEIASSTILSFYLSRNNVLEFYTGSAWGNIAQAGTATVTKSTPVTGDGTTTVFSNFFATAPADENNVIVVVGNVIQEPDQAYTISGRDITFASPPPNTHRIYAFEGFDSTDAS